MFQIITTKQNEDSVDQVAMYSQSVIKSGIYLKISGKGGTGEKHRKKS
jgi:hypothetical protein